MSFQSAKRGEVLRKEYPGAYGSVTVVPADFAAPTANGMDET